MTAPEARDGVADTAETYVDLHSHSTASDGALEPAQVVREAHRVGLRALALTDHDTVAGLAEARTEADALGLRLVSGIELSAVEGNSETHVLGLHLADLAPIESQLAALREMRVRRAERIVERLNTLGVPVTMEAVRKEAAGGAIGRPHVARALMAGKWVGDFREAFDRYLGNGRAAYVGKDQLPIADAIAMIHAAGGIAVLAHPGPAATRTRLTALAGLGLDGVEVLHPGHAPDDIGRIRMLADELGLVKSGGSDWHGSSEGPRVLGVMRVPAAWLEAQDQRVADRAGRGVAG